MKTDKDAEYKRGLEYGKKGHEALTKWSSGEWFYMGAEEGYRIYQERKNSRKNNSYEPKSKKSKKYKSSSSYGGGGGGYSTNPTPGIIFSILFYIFKTCWKSPIWWVFVACALVSIAIKENDGIQKAKEYQVQQKVQQEAQVKEEARMPDNLDSSWNREYTQECITGFCRVPNRSEFKEGTRFRLFYKCGNIWAEEPLIKIESVYNGEKLQLYWNWEWNKPDRVGDLSCKQLIAWKN